MPAADRLDPSARLPWGAGPVVCGVSPTSGSPGALVVAAAEAACRGVALEAVMAWRAPRTQAGPGTSPPPLLPWREEELAAEAEARLRGFVTAALGETVQVRCKAERGSALRVLRHASHGAALLVLDAPRRPGGSLRTGLVAPLLLAKAACPVLVLPKAGERPAWSARGVGTGEVGLAGAGGGLAR
ncbi:universal stress protein [Aciditerrimonas ferrireducens]|uniref:Universal stress protein n=1 Tax=Aciditerrimonas ferrireducens TaxID=667306 RepID=A0ABV6C2T6_9ACTN